MSIENRRKLWSKMMNTLSKLPKDLTELRVTSGVDKTYITNSKIHEPKSDA